MDEGNAKFNLMICAGAKDTAGNVHADNPTACIYCSHEYGSMTEHASIN